MGKMGLYAGIMILILLYGCKGEENEVIQDSIETETETGKTAENIHDNAFTVSASEISCTVKEGKVNENENKKNNIYFCLCNAVACRMQL